jgi:hypothetical protein
MSLFMALLTKAFIRYGDSGWRVVPTKKLLLKGFRNTRICPLNSDVFTEEDFLPANLEIINVEDPEPENKPIGILPPSPEVMTTSALSSPSVTPNAELTSKDSHNPGISCFFMDIAPLPNKKKTVNPAMNKRGKMNSEVVTFTPKKLMVEERREKQLIAQKTKEALEGGKLRKPKEKEPPKRKRQKRNKTCRRNILSESSSENEVASVNLYDDDDDDNDDVCEDTEREILKMDICFLCGNQGRYNKLIQVHFVFWL